MSEPGYLIGESLLGRIRGTVAKVEGAPTPSRTTKVAPLFEDDGGQERKAFRICTFTGAWATNASQTVTFKYQTTTPNTVTAINLFATIAAPSGTANCAVARDGTSWFLIAAACP